MNSETKASNDKCNNLCTNVAVITSDAEEAISQNGANPTQESFAKECVKFHPAPYCPEAVTFHQAPFSPAPVTFHDESLLANRETARDSTKQEFPPVVTDMPITDWIPGYCKRGDWICIAPDADSDSKNYQKLIKCDLTCLEVQDLYSDDLKSVHRLLVIVAKTVAEKQCFYISPHDLGNKLLRSLESVRGVQIASGINVSRELRNVISILSITAPVKKIITQQGWQLIEGKMHYIYNNRPKIPDFEIKCSSYIGNDTNLSTGEIFKRALSVFAKPELAGPVLLYALYGVTHRVFVEAKKRPTGILFLAGETGSLKTSLSKVFFQLFNTDEDAPIISFQSTVASLDPAIQQAKDTTLLLDDYCVNSTMTRDGRNQMQSLLDRLIRIFGDGTARRKSDLKSNMIESARASGGAVVTGEVTADGRSSLLRLITVELEKGDIVGENLLAFQTNPFLWSTFMCRYIQYLEDNFGHLVNKIATLHQKLRIESKSRFQEARSTDHFVELSLLNNILGDFLLASRMPEPEVHQIFHLLDAGIKYYIKASEQLSEEENPDLLILQTLYELLNDGTFRFADSEDVVKRNTCFDGYRNAENAYIEATTFKPVLESRLRKKGLCASLCKSTQIFSILERRWHITHKFPNGDSSTYNTKMWKNGRRVGANFFDLKALDRALSQLNL